MRRTLVVPAIAVLLSSAVLSADAERWWSSVKALANDGMEGRNTGSAAHRRAAEYVASEFQKAGLAPAGVNGYIQPVRFKTRRLLEDQSSIALVRNGSPEPLTLGEDATIGVRVDPAPAIDAPLVFAGYGLQVPEETFDDFAGLDVKGAVVVFITGGPSSIPGALRAHYQSGGERAAALTRAGAIGMITVPNPKSMDVPWARSTLARLQPQMALADPSLDEMKGVKVTATMNPAHADKLFAGSGHTIRELLAIADAGGALPRFALPARVKATVKVATSEVESQNIAGVLRGSDPKLRDEFVVLSAHVDHVGVGEPINPPPPATASAPASARGAEARRDSVRAGGGDRIYNGAMDNASGVAAIIEIANQLRERGTKPKRSLLFVAVTGEEKGLLGSRYFVAHPTVPARAIVANVNTDMFLPLFPLKELMVLGLDESDLGADIRAVAAARGLTVQADPEPNRNRFIRSDQYNFIRAGVPALAMKVGYEENTPEAAIARKWVAERYHAPSDDLDQPIDRSAAEEFAEVVRDLAVRIANRVERPKWNSGSFFRRFARTSN